MFKKRAPDVYPVALIVGLGNPGAEYKSTRHNVGFDVVEALGKQERIELKTMRHKAQYGTGMVGEVPVALVKPLTFMNLSGQSVKLIAQHYNIGLDKILIVADDLDLPTGKVRMRMDGSPGGHNGHKSIVGSMGSQAYPRIKIGIGRSEDATIDHVLSRFKPDERVLVDESIAKSIKAIKAWLAQGADAAMRIANGE